MLTVDTCNATTRMNGVLVICEKPLHHPKEEDHEGTFLDRVYSWPTDVWWEPW